MLQVKVNLKEYPKFWNALKIAQHRGEVQSAKNATEVIEKIFGFTVKILPHDHLGNVIMDEPTYTWFTLKWT